MFHHVVERKQSSDVSLRLLDPTVEFLQFLAWRCVAPLHFDLMRPQPMHQLVRHDVGKERFEVNIHHRMLRKCPPRNREQNGTELRFLNVAQHHAFASLLLHHPIIVRQIVGSRGDSVIAIARTENLVYYHRRCGRSQLGIAVLWIDRQIVFDLLQMISKHGEFLGFGIVTKVDECLKGCLIVEQFVVIDFVRSNSDIQRRVQIHPSDIAVVVIVGEECIGA